MANYYAGPGGINTNAGTSWALRKLTLAGAEALALVARDTVYCGPGVYREMLTLAKSGGALYNAGTVSVTNGSKTVTGAGTAFTTSSNVLANDVFQVSVIALGTNGVTNGTSTFTSVAGNFQAGMIGMAIRITTSGQFIISAVASATSITINNPDGSTVVPGTATGLTYNVGPERPYNIASVDSATQLTLDLPWSGPTLTAEAYETWGPITFVGDVSGVNTDGVGGSVRLTGSTSDTAANQTNNIVCTSFNYRTFRGFNLDTVSGDFISITTSTHWIIEDCTASGTTSQNSLFAVYGTTSSVTTIRRCIFNGTEQANAGLVNYNSASAVNNMRHLVENCTITGGSTQRMVQVTKVGGIIARNLTSVGSTLMVVAASMSVGQGAYLTNCVMMSCVTALTASVASTILEDYNSFFGNVADRSNVLVGSHSTTNPAIFMSYQLLSGYKFPGRDVFAYMQLSEYSVMRLAAGIYPPPDDLFGVPRPVTNSKCSWGALQFTDVSQSTTQAHAGTYSAKIADAGRMQIVVPVTAVSTVVSVWVYREANYAGTNPSMNIKQPGQADILVTDVGAVSGWNQITTTFTPAGTSDYVFVELISNNTATSGSFNVYVDDLAVA